MEFMPFNDRVVILLPSLGRHMKCGGTDCAAGPLVINKGSRRNGRGCMHSVKVPHFAQETIYSMGLPADRVHQGSPVAEVRKHDVLEAPGWVDRRDGKILRALKGEKYGGFARGGGRTGPISDRPGSDECQNLLDNVFPVRSENTRTAVGRVVEEWNNGDVIGLRDVHLPGEDLRVTEQLRPLSGARCIVRVPHAGAAGAMMTKDIDGVERVEALPEAHPKPVRRLVRCNLHGHDRDFVRGELELQR